MLLLIQILVLIKFRLFLHYQYIVVYIYGYSANRNWLQLMQHDFFMVQIHQYVNNLRPSKLRLRYSLQLYSLTPWQNEISCLEHSGN